MARSESVVIPFPSPCNPLHSHVADDCPPQAAAEHHAALLAKLLRRLPAPEMASTSSALSNQLIELYGQAVAWLAHSIKTVNVWSAHSLNPQSPAAVRQAATHNRKTSNIDEDLAHHYLRNP